MNNRYETDLFIANFRAYWRGKGKWFEDQEKRK